MHGEDSATDSASMNQKATNSRWPFFILNFLARPEQPTGDKSEEDTALHLIF